MTRILRIPFIGNKANRIKEIIEIVKDGGYTRVIEPFGGSCMISVNIYNQLGIECIANDYDRYFEDFEDLLDMKDKLMAYLDEQGVKKSDKKKLKPEEVKIVQDYVKHLTPRERKYLSVNFMFSAKRTRYTGEDWNDFRYFMNDTTTERAREFYKAFQELKTDSMDYRDFINKYATGGCEKTLIILDPPYLNSEQKSYDQDGFFGLSETIELFKKMDSFNTDFIFFNQIEKDTRALLELFKFDHDITTVFTSVASHKAVGRQDVMAVVKV